MNQKRIGLFLAYKGYNYGAQLQAFATQWILDNLGVKTEVVEYKKGKHDRSFYFDKDFIFHVLPTAIIKKLRKNRSVKISESAYVENRQLRDAQRKRFVKERFHDIVNIEGLKNLVSYSRGLYAVLIGSDQKWIPGFSFGSVDSLMFAPSNVKRISYSTSLGVSEYPKYCWKTARKCWTSIDYLSVREEQGANIIRNVCGDIPVKVLCDPTYVVTKEEWEKLIPFKRMYDEKYIVCYILGNDEETYLSARRYADKKGLKLISLLSCESYTPKALSFADVIIKGSSPEDFVNWIRGSEFLITDSFHGLAFAVINEKQFFVYYRKRDDAKLSRNSRIDNVLAKWNLTDRLVLDKNCNWDSESESFIDYSIVTPLVLKERDQAIEFLKQAIL